MKKVRLRLIGALTVVAFVALAFGLSMNPALMDPGGGQVVISDLAINSPPATMPATIDQATPAFNPSPPEISGVNNNANTSSTVVTVGVNGNGTLVSKSGISATSNYNQAINTEAACRTKGEASFGAELATAQSIVFAISVDATHAPYNEGGNRCGAYLATVSQIFGAGTTSTNASS